VLTTNLRALVRAGRKFEFTWRYLFNLQPTLAYQFSSKSLPGEAVRVLADLNRDGIAITSVQKLFGANSYYNELSTAVDGLEDDLAKQLKLARTTANDSDAVGRKTFIVELLGARPVLDLHNVYARFALQKPVLQIANSYFGMYTRLRYYNVWHTFATQTQARESQLWHRDREDYYILKMFLYLSDVDESAGPFTYAAGSHLKGQLRQEPVYFLEGDVKRSADADMAEVVPRERWIKGVGSKGTIIFADTRGYHKGGLARERDRIMYTCMFTSHASESKEFLMRPDSLSLPSDAEQAFALTSPRQRAWPIRMLAKGRT
jgi:phytanoyl-CoA dioxygenase PhyH